MVVSETLLYLAVQVVIVQQLKLLKFVVEFEFDVVEWKVFDAVLEYLIELVDSKVDLWQLNEVVDLKLFAEELEQLNDVVEKMMLVAQLNYVGDSNELVELVLTEVLTGLKILVKEKIMPVKHLAHLESLLTETVCPSRVQVELIQHSRHCHAEGPHLQINTCY